MSEAITEITCPSKTFLLGEYLALHGGPSLVLNTLPAFRLSIHKGPFALQGIHPDSPAGRFIRAHFSEQEKQFHFDDPYQGLGGFGASTAQFLAAYCFYEGHTDFNADNLLASYLEYAYAGTGMAPSGADLIAQWQGAISYFEKQQSLETLTWPFESLHFALIHTQKKLATHEHLASLEQMNTDDLKAPVLAAKAALQDSDAETIVAAINEYQQRLQAKSLSAKHSLALLADIKRLPGVRAAKGCGAMGSDVLLVLYEPDAANGLKDYCGQADLKWIARDRDLAPATTMHVVATSNL